MPPSLALFAGFALVAWLIRTDMQHRTVGSSALWIPALLLVELGARPLGYWLNLIGIGSAATNTVDSDPWNAFFHAAVILGSIAVLSRRNINWPKLAGENKALVAMYLFFTLSSIWSPDSFVTFRRVLKDFGTVFIVLVMLTEPRPWFACRVVYTRVCYFLLPISLVTSKYYPAVGRYAFRSGDTSYTGLTPHKNTLGEVVLICILFIIWDLTQLPQELNPRELKLARRQRYLILAIGGLLLAMAGSATAEICLILGTFLFFAFRKLATMPRGRRIFRTALVVIVLAGLADKTLGISSAVAEMFGRDMTLTGRTEIWAVTLRHQSRPLVGYGFYSFWDTDVAFTIYDELGDFIHIRTVHNGFLEVYIDGGLIGIAFLGLVILAAWRTNYRRIFDSVPPFSLPLVFWIITMIYNNSESSFFRLDMLWFTFLTLTIRFPAQETPPPLFARSEA